MTVMAAAPEGDDAHFAFECDAGFLDGYDQDVHEGVADPREESEGPPGDPLPVPDSEKCRVCPDRKLSKKHRYCAVHKRACDSLYRDAQSQDRRAGDKVASTTFNEMMKNGERTACANCAKYTCSQVSCWVCGALG